MAVKLICDGCWALLEPTEAARVGDLAPVEYCGACREVYAATLGMIDAARISAVETFTAARAAILTEARSALKLLPDGG